MAQSELSTVWWFWVTGCCTVGCNGPVSWVDWPHITCSVRCHGDHPHSVCLIRATAGFSSTVRPVHWWAPVGCVSCVSCCNCVSRRRLILTWMIRPPGRQSGQSTADQFCSEPAPAGLASAVTSTPEGDGSWELVSRLVRGRPVPGGNGSLTVGGSQALESPLQLNCQQKSSSQSQL